MRLGKRHLLAVGTSLFALSMAVVPARAADPIKIGLSGPFTGGSSSMGVSMRDGVKLAVDEINKAGGVLGRPLAAGRARRRGAQRARRADRAGADQQGAGGRHPRLHQHRRRPGLAALLPGSRDPGDQQRRHRHGDHPAVRQGAVQLRLPHRRQRPDPGADDRRGGDRRGAASRSRRSWPTAPITASSAARTWRRRWPPRA